MKKRQIIVVFVLISLLLTVVSCRKKQETKEQKAKQEPKVEVLEGMVLSNIDLNDREKNIHGTISFPRTIDTLTDITPIYTIWEKDLQDFAKTVKEENLMKIEKDTNMFNFTLLSMKKENDSIIVCNFLKQLHFATHKDTIKENVSIKYNTQTKTTNIISKP
ncbi:MAG: hypothetical protein IJ213_03170 [Bacteroidales bacterium]|nr:hypothetical protein [Bacteroidales bacterium]